AGAGGGPADPRLLLVGRSRQAPGADEPPGACPGGVARRVADGPVPSAVGLPARSGRPAPPVAGPPEPLVQPGRLLPAPRLRRPARPLPRRAAVEADLLAGVAGRRPC